MPKQPAGTKKSVNPPVSEQKALPENPFVKKSLVIFLVIGIFVMFVLFNIYIYQYSRHIARSKTAQRLFPIIALTNPLAKPMSQTPTPSPTPTPTPAPIAQGKQIYTVNSNVKDGPRIIQVIVDPFDPKKGENQSMTVQVSGTAPITEVSVTLLVDGMAKKIYPLTRQTPVKSGQETWQGSWKTDTTHNYTYKAQVSASDGKRTTSNTLSFRP